MSSNKALIIFVIFIWTIIGGYYFVADEKDPHAGHNHGPMTAKLSAGVDVQFEMTNQEPKPNEELEVFATLHAFNGDGEYNYKIFMPGNTELISPASEGVLILSEEEDTTLRILFSQSVDYDMKVHMEIRKPGSPNASMFTFSTLDFQKNQEEIEALQERKAAYGK